MNSDTGLIAPLVQSFFTDHLVRQRHASPQTVASYRDTFRLLIQHLSQTMGKKPSDLTLGQSQGKATAQAYAETNGNPPWTTCRQKRSCGSSTSSNETAVIVFRLGTRGWQRSGPFFGW